MAQQQGFTLVELIFSIALLGMLGAMGGWVFVNGFTLVRSVNTDSAMVSELSMTADRLARELREIKLDAAGSYCITSALPAAGSPTGSITFNKATADVAAACGTSDMQVTLARVTGTGPTDLRMTYSQAPAVANAVLTNTATRFEMRFLDGSLGNTATLAQVRFIDVTLTLQPSGGRAASTRMVVGLRNQ